MKFLKIAVFISVLGYLLIQPSCTEEPLQSERTYVILVSLDGFRWDYIERGLSPNIENIARRGVSARSLEPVFPTKTFPTHYSIVTGLHPGNHGIISNRFTDPATGERFYPGNRAMTENPRFYQGEAIWETLRKNGIVTASYFWPGSEVTDEERRPNYFHRYDGSRPNIERVEAAIEWLKLPETERPQFITLYFSDVDSEGHRTGPYSDEMNSAITHVDSLIGMLTGRLADIGMFEKTNIILVSDHGMTEVSPDRVINIRDIIRGYDVTADGVGAITMIRPENPEETGAVYRRLKENGNNYSVYLKEEIPEYWNYSNHEFILPVLVVADVGWSLSLWPYDPARNHFASGGNHGYDNRHPDMHGIFYAAGPAFKSGYRTDTIRMIDIYPLLCALFGIEPAPDIDGEFKNMVFLLED